MSTPNKPTAKAIYPLPLSSTLHDLALLRASDLDLASLLPTAPVSSSGGKEHNVTDPAVDESVKRSLEFSREARAALKLLYSDAVDREGARVDEVREKLEDVMKGLDGNGEEE
ncbi:hypothetical protein BD309DRAFT_930419 [Dichomitus squalens]|uniref:Uncharacterized protein n=2 Tax=Dichomitus squalens TaxID=114155 RepID=A0A4V2K303_9APHY|nr:uncharacterized protein DICSQDRAFT_107588 [Dichomitus squalens LYAD-421 SS1]EJF60474.1 hypothetical protein DICSQDRAFT_107588 [Dichomitus squalens LYAD-421 SS1]TBU38593.1 hypothetical protein BD309DRAFT_930419 [Dichomitus squalens]TBU55037.1 hypothetical protein BD310DRAFT_716069 [Dichomitus squalens]